MRHGAPPRASGTLARMTKGPGECRPWGGLGGQTSAEEPLGAWGRPTDNSDSAPPRLHLGPSLQLTFPGKHGHLWGFCLKPLP